ncbi:MAG: hypothetical protein ABH817_02075 [archaeon]
MKKKIKFKKNLLQNQKNRKYIVILLLIFLVLSTFSLLLYFGISKVTVIPIKLRVGNYVGLVKTDELIDFGTLIWDTTIEQKLSITSPNKHKVRLFTRGAVSKFVTIPENNFWLEPNVTKEISIIGYVPITANAGEYNGDLIIVFSHF